MYIGFKNVVLFFKYVNVCHQIKNQVNNFIKSNDAIIINTILRLCNSNILIIDIAHIVL